MLFEKNIFLGCVKSVLCCSMASKDVESFQAPASATTSTENTTSSASSATTTASSTASSATSSSAATSTDSSSVPSTGKSAATSVPSSISSAAASASTEGESVYTSRSELFSSPIEYDLKEGQFLHDSRDGDKTLMAFANHVGAMNVFDIFLDYTRVITQDKKQSANAFYKDENLLFNRYNDIRCIDSTRVIVPTSDGKDYLHANYVDGYRENKKYILTQAPMDATIEKFWEMVWKENSTMIISLTALDGEKCPIYLPVKVGESKEYGTIKVVNMGTRNIRDSYDSTNLMITKDGAPIRTILHIIFHSWPNKETPTRPTEILYFIDDINFNRKILIRSAQNKGWLTDTSKSPIIIHCKAGVGRSGALCAIDICARKLDDTFKRGDPAVDVRDTVLRLRTQREMAVQKPEQYLYIHLSVLEYAIRKRYFDSIEDVQLDLFLYRKSKK